MGALFGGGTKLDLTLDVDSAPQGGQVSGKVVVHGGKKALSLTSLKVRVGKVKVQMKEGSSLPDIQTEQIAESVLAVDEALPAGVAKPYAFKLRLPAGIEPSSLGVSYKVLGHADIPGVADPSADAKLKIVEGTVSAMLTVEDILARWPGLEAASEEEILDALRELHNACYAQRETLLAAEPILIQRFQGASSPKVRREAFKAWANLVDDQVRPDHLRLLADVSAAQHDAQMFAEIVTAVAKFAEEGALPMLEQLAQNPDAGVRAKVGKSIRFDAKPEFPGRRELLNKLVTDPEADVRAAAIGALSTYRDDAPLMHWIAALATRDSEPEVRAACVAALNLAHNYGIGDLPLALYESQITDPSPVVRQAIAENLHWQPEAAKPRVLGLVERLFADSSDDVREAAAFQMCNLEQFPEIAQFGRRAALGDSSERVRHDALRSLASVMPLGELLPLYESVLASNPSERVWRGVLRGAGELVKERSARAFLEKIAKLDSAMGAYARDVLA
ncbi:MAG TPA: HEAT repeat domain-containing protein [Polyangiaceae bacterium]|jgi:hypothetical protein